MMEVKKEELETLLFKSLKIDIVEYDIFTKTI